MCVCLCEKISGRMIYIKRKEMKTQPGLVVLHSRRHSGEGQESIDRRRIKTQRIRR